MPVESAADRLLFLDTDEFAAEGVIQELPTGSDTIHGILDRDYVEVLGHSSVKPVFFVRDSETTAVGNSITIESITYTIQDIQPDGTGMKLLILEKQ